MNEEPSSFTVCILKDFQLCIHQKSLLWSRGLSSQKQHIIDLAVRKKNNSRAVNQRHIYKNNRWKRRIYQKLKIFIISTERSHQHHHSKPNRQVVE